MEIKTLTDLKKNGNIFELQSTIYTNANKPIGIYAFPVQDKHTMRIDLICDEIYNNMNEISLLCETNGIINPLSIKFGDIIYFVDEEDVEYVKNDNDLYNKIIENIQGANIGKQQKTDNNRLNDVNNRIKSENNKKYIPPHIKSNVNSSIEINNGVIKLKPNF